MGIRRECLADAVQGAASLRQGDQLRGWVGFVRHLPSLIRRSEAGIKRRQAVRTVLSLSKTDWDGQDTELYRRCTDDLGQVQPVASRIGPTGEELPPGRGTAKEGAQLYRAKGVRGMPRGDGDRGQGADFEKQGWPGCRALGTGTNTAASLAVRDDGVGLHQSRHASQQRRNVNRR